ncbi:MAG: FCD domain-containing protein [Candidatus Thiodiazotropha sp.]
MIAAHEAGEALVEAQADAEFHLAIAEASHNEILVQIMRSLFVCCRQMCNAIWISAISCRVFLSRCHANTPIF